MSQIILGNLDTLLEAKLRARAAKHGRPVEDEACEILRVALSVHRDDQSNLPAQIRRRLKKAGGGIDLELTGREAMREPPADLS